MTGPELCDKLGVDAARLAAWLEAGLPHKLIEGEPDFLPDQVAAWLLEHGHATRSDSVSNDTDGQTIVRTIAEVANYFNVSSKSVANWLKDPDFPGTAGERGRQNGRFPIEAIAAWRDARDGTTADEVGSTARERKWQADAEIRELELAKLRGELIEIEIVASEITRAINNAKAVLGDLADELIDELPAKVRVRYGPRLRRRIEKRLRQAYQRLEEMAELDDENGQEPTEQ